MRRGLSALLLVLSCADPSTPVPEDASPPAVRPPDTRTTSDPIPDLEPASEPARTACVAETMAFTWDLIDVAGDEADGAIYATAYQESRGRLHRLRPGGHWEEVVDADGFAASQGSVIHVAARGGAVFARLGGGDVLGLQPGGLWQSVYGGAGAGAGHTLAAGADAVYVDRDYDRHVYRVERTETGAYGAAVSLGPPSGLWQVRGLAEHGGTLYALRTVLSRYVGDEAWEALPGAPPLSEKLVAGPDGLFGAGFDGAYQYELAGGDWVPVADIGGATGPAWVRSVGLVGRDLLVAEHARIRRLAPLATWEDVADVDGWSGGRLTAGAAAPAEVYVADRISHVVWRHRDSGWAIVVDSAGSTGGLEQPRAVAGDSEQLYVGGVSGLHRLRAGLAWESGLSDLSVVALARGLGVTYLSTSAGSLMQFHDHMGLSTVIAGGLALRDIGWRNGSVYLLMQDGVRRMNADGELVLSTGVPGPLPGAIELRSGQVYVSTPEAVFRSTAPQAWEPMLELKGVRALALSAAGDALWAVSESTVSRIADPLGCGP